jgi:hypothetical protein
LLFGLLSPPVGTGVVLGVVAPRFGWWDPDAVGDATDGRKVLAAGVLWYLFGSVVVGVTVWLVVVLLFLPVV